MGFIRTKSFKKFAAVAFVIYLACLCYLAFFSYSYGRTLVHKGINIKPFSTIELFLSSHLNPGAIITNIVGNIAAFIPMGLLLPLLWKKFKNFINIFITLFLSTLAIEITQRITSVGAFDVDDIILNVLGGVIGFIIIKIILRLVRE